MRSNKQNLLTVHINNYFYRIKIGNCPKLKVDLALFETFVSDLPDKRN